MTYHEDPGVVEVYIYSFFKLGARCGWVVNATPRPLYPWERDPVPIVQEVGWAPGSSMDVTTHRQLSNKLVPSVFP